MQQHTSDNIEKVVRYVPKPKSRSSTRRNSVSSSCSTDIGDDSVSISWGTVSVSSRTFTQGLLEFTEAMKENGNPLSFYEAPRHEEPLATEQAMMSSENFLQALFVHPRMVELRALVRNDTQAANKMLAMLPEVDPYLASRLEGHHDEFLAFLTDDLMTKVDQDPLAALIGSFHRARDSELEQNFTNLCAAYGETMPKVVEMMGSLKKKANAHSAAMKDISACVKQLKSMQMTMDESDESMSCPSLS